MKIRKYPDGVYGIGKFYTFLLDVLVGTVGALWVKRLAIPKNFPRGNFIVASNHQSYLDFALLLFAFRGEFAVFFINQRSYFSPWFNFALKRLGQIPTVKGQGIRLAIKALEGGDNVFIFPEGGLGDGGKLREFKSGVAVLAENFPDIPVFPVGIAGSSKIWGANQKYPRIFLGRKVGIKIGEPFYFRDFCNKDLFLRELENKLVKLL